MKKTISLLIVLMMILGTGLLYTGCSGSQTAELNILNWGDYIDPELIERFEQETGIHVNYTTMTSNEEMIIKLRFGLNNADGKEKTQKEVADLLGISQSYISRLEKRIMKRLKKEIIKYE